MSFRFYKSFKRAKNRKAVELFKLVAITAIVTKLLFINIFFFLALIIHGQVKPPVKFGKISPDNFKTKIYSIDSSASAVIIADMGSSQVIANTKGWFSIEFRHFKRIHILNKNSYDLADVEILLYKEGNDEEEIKNLKAHTYNLEKGKIIEAKLDVKNSVFKTVLSKNHVAERFTFPALKEGSIIEFEYTIYSDFIFNLQPWKFQGDYPCLWSEYEVSIPDFFYYVFLQKGNIIKTQKSRQESFRITDSRRLGPSTNESFFSTVSDHRMLMKNIPALREENFTTNLDNHIAKVEFQLAELRSPLTPQNIMGDWTDVCRTLLKDEYFGEQLNKDNSWMNDELKIILRGAANDNEKAKNIYKYLQGNFTCTNYNSLYTTQSLKSIFKTKMGNEAEINLLLAAMFRKAGLTADPLMLSTRSHGYVYDEYPIMERFNYVICHTKINDKDVYLDASKPYLGFGRLHWECYNGHARVIDTAATPVYFSSDSLVEKKITSLMLTFNNKGDMNGFMQQTPGHYESCMIREQIKQNGWKEFLYTLNKEFGPNVEVKDLRIDSLENFENQIQVNYTIHLNPGKESTIYFNPMFVEGYKENPFKPAHRIYPVEMPYIFDEIYVLQLNVPDGYEVDALPGSTRVDLDEEGKSFFEYIIGNTGTLISLRSRVKMSRSYFLPGEYELLRDFFTTIVNKQSEQIVFKKKKQL